MRLIAWRANISSAVGKLFCVPSLVTLTAATSFAHAMASLSSAPAAIRAAKAPKKLSPAPVVSRASAARARAKRGSAPGVKRAQPRSPRVTSTFPAPFFSNSCAAAATSSSVPVGNPVSSLSSGSFGQIMSQSGQIWSGSCLAGAVFSRVVTPSSRATLSAARVAPRGASSCAMRRQQPRISARAASASAADNVSNAPGMMMIEFCPVVSSTVMGATPEATFVARVTCCASTPCCSKLWSVSSPNLSSPTLEIIMTSAPKRAACTAWLAPLPPKPVENFVPCTVSPGFGIRGP
mmetsp:Transcript_88495/g.222779  ORF Transcript_88495/g.222779 Transcript_88495/m.222779 type:complete len:293 (-) Transcript_88495:138-1016(-)